MSKGNPQAGGSTSGFGSQGQFGAGYTQPYGSPGAGAYDPMLGFGQTSGMGTTFNYPNRYSADYTRYAQSGMPFNQPVMGYNSYGQIFAQPQRPPPTMGKGGGGFRPPQPPAMGGKGGGGFQPGYGGFQPGYGGFQPGYGYRPPTTGRDRLGMPLITDLPQQPSTKPPPTMGGKGGPQPENDDVTISYPGGSRTVPRSPERRTRQLGLNNEPSPLLVRSPSVQVPANQTGPVTGGPGATPPPLTGGVPNDFTVGPESPRPVIFPQRDRNLNPAAGRGPPGDNTDYRPVESNFVGILPTGGLNNDVRFGPSNPYTDDLVMSPVRADRQVIDENIYNSPFNQLIGTGINRPSAGDTMFDTRAFENFRLNQDFGRMAFQEGGQVPPDAASNIEMMMAETAQPEMGGEYDRLIQMTMQAILGQVESPDEVIQMFIDEFGVDAFRQLRDAVLKQQVPGAQTEGMVDGNGGGMDDQVMGMIGNQRPVAVSPGEYIVPADVVSGLGDGSSQSGADILDELNQAVRMTRTGTTQQPRPLMETLQQ